MEKKLKVEKTRIKQEARDKKSQLLLHNTVPEVEHLIEQVDVQETDNHIVTITTMDTMNIAGHLGYGMGINSKAAVEDAIAKKQIKQKTVVEASAVKATKDKAIKKKKDEVKKQKPMAKSRLERRNEIKPSKRAKNLKRVRGMVKRK